MGDRITTRRRRVDSKPYAGGYSTIAKGGSLAEPRVKFVNGFLTGYSDPLDGSVACGDGTAFPMQVTLDQVCEIFYRVKDAKFVGGSAIYDISGTEYLFTAPSDAPTNRTLEIDPYAEAQSRGYTTGGATIFTDDAYDAGSGNYFSDINSREPSMWRFGSINAFSSSWLDTVGLKTSDPYWWDWNNGEAITADAYFGSRVAVIRTSIDAPVFDPANVYYLELEINAFGGAPPNDIYINTNIYDPRDASGDWSAVAYASGSYVMRLRPAEPDAIPPVPAVEIACPIYASAPYVSGDYCTHAATEWWPFAHAEPLPSPFFNRFNGDLIPPFTPAQLNFNVPNNANLIAAL